MKKEFQIGDILRAKFVGGIYHFLVLLIDDNSFPKETRYYVKPINNLDQTSVLSISSFEPYFKDVEKVS